MKHLHLYIPDDLHEKLRREAFDGRISISQLVVGKIHLPPEPARKSQPKAEFAQAESPTLCKHGKEKTYCTVSNCENYASWR